MLLKMLLLTRRFSTSAAISLMVHATVIVGLLYVSEQETIAVPKFGAVPFAVTRVDVVTFATQQSVMPASEHSAAALKEVQSETVIEPGPVLLAEPIKKQSVKRKVKSLTLAAPAIVKSTVNKAIKTDVKKTRSPTNLLPQSEFTNAITTLENNENTLIKSIDSAVVAGKAETQGPYVLSKVKPVYPARALALGIEGQVKVQYDIDGSGRVTNIRVLEAKPRNMFEREVKQVMRKWRFEAVAARDYVTTVIFKIDGEMEMR